MTASIDRARIERTHSLIRPHIRLTPVVTLTGADLGLQDFPLTLKLELLQHAGSFKTRGAFTNLLTRAIPPAGVVAASGGNHGAAVASAAMRLGVPAHIFVLTASLAFAARSGALPVHAFDQEETLLGQGTIGLELAQQAPDLDTLLVAVGGGGLIGGIAAWCRGAPRVIGVEPEAAPTLTRALAAGKPVDAEAGGIAADSLAPRRVGELMFSIAQAHVARIVLVPDAAIRRAQEALWESLRVVAEPGGAAALSALLAGAYVPAPGERVGVLVSGGNTTAVDFGR